MAYCFMSTEKIKSLGAFTRKYEHNYRTGNVPNADKNRAHLNEEIVALPEGKTYVDVFREKMAAAGHTPRSNAVYGVELVMTYNSREVDEDFDIEKWKEANVEWLKTQFPEECILSVVMHRDEGPDNGRSAHLHAVVVPMHDGKLNCKHYLSGRKKLIDMQDSYGKAMEPLGLERGLKGSSAKHEDIRRFYDTLNKTLSENVPQIEENETIEEYYERISNWYTDKNIVNLEKTKKMERENAELRTKLKTAFAEARVDVRKDAEETKKAKEAAKKKLALIEQKEEELNAKLKELGDAEVRLKNFTLLMNGMKTHPDEMFVAGLSEDIAAMIEWQQQYEQQQMEREDDEDRDDEFET